MCKYCEGNRSRATVPMFDKQDTYIGIFGNSLTVINDDKGGLWCIDLQIGFCPMCGEKL